MTAPPLLSIYQLPIVLRGISPLIWRRVLVHRETTLAHLHTVLQILLAWSDEHLHSFHIHGKEYGSSGAPTRGVWLRDQTPPRHPCHQWELKPTGSCRGKSRLGTRPFFPLESANVLHFVVFFEQ